MSGSSQALEAPKLVSVHGTSGCSSFFPSSSTSEISELPALRYDTTNKVAKSKGADGAVQPPCAEEIELAGIGFGTNKSSVERKYEAVADIDGQNTSRATLSGRGLIRDGRKSQLHGEKQCISRVCRLWEMNRSCLLVIIAVIFGSTMTLFTKILETAEHDMHPLQILFLRMFVTSVVCYGHLYFFKKDCGSPFGSKELRWLLILRGVFGFFGLCGIWMSIRFLDLADATVITFLTPSMVAVFSAIVLRQPFTRKEQLASVLAMIGVVFIARPAVLFGNPVAIVADNMTDGSETEMKSPASDRAAGTVLALISATGGAGAFISIRTIGARANIFTMTLYFAVICTIISGTALLVAPLIDYDQPSMRFGMARGTTQWTLMAGIIVCGLLTQLLLTAGLSGETKTNKAPAMVYTGMLWTVGFDRWVFGEKMYWSSVMGCLLIVGGAIWMVMQPKADASSHKVAHDIDIEAGNVTCTVAATATSEETAPMIMELQMRQRDEEVG